MRGLECLYRHNTTMFPSVDKTTRGFVETLTLKRYCTMKIDSSGNRLNKS